MDNRHEQITCIFRAFRDAVETVNINERNYKDKLIAMYSLCASTIKKENMSIIPNDAQEAYKFLIRFRECQIKDRQIRDAKHPECQNLDINYKIFFKSLGSRASKAIQAIYKVYFALQKEIYKPKEEYLMLL